MKQVWTVIFLTVFTLLVGWSGLAALVPILALNPWTAALLVGFIILIVVGYTYRIEQAEFKSENKNQSADG